MNVLFNNIEQGQPDDVIINGVVNVCDTFQIYTDRVCRGVITLMLVILQSIARYQIYSKFNLSLN